MFAWSLLKGLERAVKQRGTKRTAWISNMAWQDNKPVINVTGKQTNKQMFSLARQVTQDYWVAVFSAGPGADIFSSLAMLMCQRSRHAGTRLKRRNRKSVGQHSQRKAHVNRCEQLWHRKTTIIMCKYVQIRGLNWIRRTGVQCSAVLEYEIRRSTAMGLKLWTH